MGKVFETRIVGLGDGVLQLQEFVGHHYVKVKFILEQASKVNNPYTNQHFDAV
jgi:hypothetical protein